MEKETLQRDTKKLGIFAEGVARRFLIKKGYEILAANYKMTFGELDIVAKKEGIISFVEVKANKRLYEGFEPEMRVDPRKQNKLIKLATAYMLSKGLHETPWQIDIVSVVFDFDNKKARIKHFKNAVYE